MGHIFRHLAENPDQQEDLRRNPDKIDSAITELMRAYGAVTITRTCVKDTAVAGIQIKEGDKVCYSTALAARDPEIYDAPEKIIFDRESKLYSIGTGIHVCIGMHIARRELRAAIRALLELLPPFRLPSGTIIESDLGTVFMPLKLPLEWDL
jgi:cytochrome P450